MKEKKQNFYFYEGLFTKPNCDETIYWLIVEEVQYCSKAQIELIKKRIDDNYREVEPLISYKSLNDRVVYRTVIPKKVGSFRMISIIVISSLILIII